MRECGSIIKVRQAEIDHFIQLKDGKKFDEFLLIEENKKLCVSLITYLNYFENLCLGVKQDLLGKEFVKKFFDEIFITYYNR